MVFSDGECPVCEMHKLHLNTSDRLECPNCRLVCCVADPLIAAVMPFLGRSSFRLEDCELRQLHGTAFAQAQSGFPLPDIKKIFQSREDLKSYLRQLSDAAAVKTESERLCDAFTEAFKRNLLQVDSADLATAMRSKRARTSFYAKRLMPAIAHDLRLRHGTEEFKVDYVMSKETANGNLVPKIYIESENDFAAANHEIRKLCSVTTPLRVLITVTDKEFSAVPGQGAYKQLRDWECIIQDHHKELPGFFNGILCILVARITAARLEFLSCAFRSTADMYRPLAPLLSQDFD